MSAAHSTSRRRVLLLLAQLPQDPASGAARSMRTIARMLAASGDFEVSALATTASEGGNLPGGPGAHLRAAGFAVEVRPAEQRASGPVEICFDDGGIDCRLLDTRGRPRAMQADHARMFDRMLKEELGRGVDVVLTYGGQPHEVAWRREARAAGAAVVFAVRNWGYLHAAPDFFTPGGGIDALLACSRFLADKYQSALGVQSVALPLPLDLDDVAAPASDERVFLTCVNPSPEKGVMFFARLADELARNRPDLPMLVIESRARAGNLLAAARRGGLDLRRHESIMISPGVAHPREIYAVSRVVLMPSVWEEPAGRVAAEAMLNGVPPIVSDRGGLAEVCAGGGTVLPLPETLRVETTRPVSRTEVAQWREAIERFYDDESYYAAACRRALDAAVIYRPENLAPRYCEFFSRVQRRG